MDSGGILGAGKFHAAPFRHRRHNLDARHVIPAQRDAQDGSLSAVGRVGLIEQKVAQAIGHLRLLDPLDPLQDVRPVPHDDVRPGLGQRLRDTLLARAGRGLVFTAPVDGDHDHVRLLRCGSDRLNRSI